jgi:23S rRNA pseudouridine1911/1915/1917 synthase
MMDPAFEILYESEVCLAVSKPPGVLTQSPPGIDSLEVRIKDYLRAKGNVSDDVYLGVPHRLDRPASGAMIFGKTYRATQKLGMQFERRRVKKTYWACVEGQVSPETDTWNDILRKVPGIAQAEIVAADHPEGRTAVLHYRVLGVRDWGTWLEITLETGRTHQIRIQTGSRGHPILGDSQYGATLPFGPQYEDLRLRLIALHSRRLTFFDPSTKQPVEVTAALPSPWEPLGL